MTSETQEKEDEHAKIQKIYDHTRKDLRNLFKLCLFLSLVLNAQTMSD